MASQYCCHLSLLILFLFYWICDATDHYDIFGFELARRHDCWMATHKRTYKDYDEKARRFEIFKKNIKYIEEFNNNANGRYKYTLGEGPFTDMTTEEFLAMYASEFEVDDPTYDTDANEGFSILKLSDRRYEEVNEDIFSNYTCPSSVDWTTRGAVSSVKDQGSCGCSWAFTTVGTVESSFKIKKGVLYDLSAQQLVDCGNSAPNGCRKGSIRQGLGYIQGPGITTSANYPYKGVSCKCNKEKERQAVLSIEGAACVKVENEEAMRSYIAQQPVGTVIEVTKEFQHYKSGILHRGEAEHVSSQHYKAPTSNHAVLLVGYGTINNTEYWKFKNSWGEKWGDKGFGEYVPSYGNPKTKSLIEKYIYVTNL